jgi:hypothetical protein
MSPRQIVPTLTDRDMYLASESAFYRVMRKYGLQHHQARSRPPTSRPKALTATGPNQVYSWDITYLLSRVRGVYFYLYLVVDIWSRRIVGWVIHDVESGDLAAVVRGRNLQQTAADRHDSKNEDHDLHRLFTAHRIEPGPTEPVASLRGCSIGVPAPVPSVSLFTSQDDVTQYLGPGRYLLNVRVPLAPGDNAPIDVIIERI